MRYGIFSDIHSNREAFEAVITAMASDHIDQYICVGDIVGYGADPAACIRLTKEITPYVICGNHDWASAGAFDTAYFNRYAKEAVLWTAGKLNESDAEYLKALRTMYEEGDFIVVHGSLEEPEKFHYILDLHSAVQTFSLLKKKTCFIGHSHSPVIFSKKGDDISCGRPARLMLEEGASYIVNVGSVGQPRDGDPRACYCIYDTGSGSVEIKRVIYDIEKAQRKILDAGLPAYLSERIASGR